MPLVSQRHLAAVLVCAAVAVSASACSGSSGAKTTSKSSTRPSPTISVLKKPSQLAFKHITKTQDTKVEKVVPLMHGVSNVTYYPKTGELVVYFRAGATSVDQSAVRQEVRNATRPPAKKKH